MGIFNRKKEKDELALVFDIGSSSVGGALFYIRKSGVPKIIYSVREPMLIGDKIDVNLFLASMIKSLKIVTSAICVAGLGAPKTIFCVLSSPWHVSQTRIIKLEKNAPFLFTSKLAESLIQKEIALFEADLAKYASGEGKVKSIELKNIKIMLNGYETPDPLNKKAIELEMTIFISMSPEQVLKNIEDAIKNHFSFNEIKFSSFLLSSFAVVRDMYIYSDSFLLINVGGEVTDISMVKKHILRESISFPLGINFMVRKIASILNCSLSEAKSYISLFMDGHASESISQKLGPDIDKLKKEWQQKFQKSLANLSNDISIPATIYIIVDKNEADFFSKIIETEQFNQYTLTESKFRIIFLGAEVFHGMVEFEGNIVRDPGLIIDCVYMNRFLNKTPQ